MVDHTMLCVHGGLGPEWTTLGQVTKMKRPINDFDNDVLNAMLWSDPTFDTDDFAPSNRGIGYLFGKNTVNDFIKRTGIKVIVRAHECVNSGFQGLFDGKLLTVFSASNYCGVIGNQSAVLQVTSAFRYEPFRFPSLPYLRRGQAIFRVEVIEQAITSRNLPKRQSIPSVHSTLAHLNRPQPNKPHFESPRKAGNQPKITRPLTSYRVTKSLESRIYGHH